MELRQLKYFVTIADTLNFSKAATQLFISQPSLSKQIALLESDLGVALFKRNRQKVELTECGRVLYIKAKEILEKAEVVPALMSAYAAAETQEKVLINIGITDVLLNIPLHAKAFLHAEERIQEKYPEVEIHLLSTRMSRVRKELNNRLLDLGIVLTDDLQNKNLADSNYSIFLESPIYLVSSGNSDIEERPTKDKVREFLNGKDIFVYNNRTRVHMQAHQICGELDARPNSISTVENPRLFVKIARGEGVTFSWDGVVERSLRQYLHFTVLPVPSAKVFSLFIWGNANQYIQDFCNAYWKYISANSSEFWCPVAPEE